jgi:hypothetical protein
LSKIALQGDSAGTGTFTISAPNSSANPVLTLPTTSGTVVVTGGAQTIEFAAGSASTPSITFTGDTNTGIFSPGADTIAFSEGGAEAARLDSSGNLLVGTTTAVQKLTVNGYASVNGNNISADNSLGFRNRIINGDMRIDQRNAGASGTAVNVYTTDRFRFAASQTSKLTWGQNLNSVTPPVGFNNYLGFSSSSAYSVTSGDFFLVDQRIEGFNVADLGWGTANAKTVTLSFWVRSSLTGTFGGALTNSAGTRSYAFTYTISSANTWEQKTITIAGDTSGTWLTNNGIGIILQLSLGTGSTYTGTAGAWASAYYISATGATSVVGTNGATFYITGVQLEVGSVATPFERRDYGRELIMCQRYFVSQGGEAVYERFFNGVSRIASTTLGNATYNFPVTMRAAPTLSTISLSSTLLQASTPTTVAIDQATTRNITINITVASGLTASSVQEWYASNSLAPRVQLSAEL